VDGSRWRILDRLGHGTERRDLERAADKGCYSADPRSTFCRVRQRLNLIELFDRLPKRFSRAALLENVPRSLGLKIVALFSTAATGQKLLAGLFTPEMGFGTIVHVDTTDGIRVLFDNGDVAHVRPSGNADELRIYSVADTQVRADAIAAMGIAEPDGILRCMQKSVAVDA
jgi:phosphomannomutase